MFVCFYIDILNNRKKIPNNESEKTNVGMSSYFRFLHQEGKVLIKEFMWRYLQFAVRSIYRYAKRNPLLMEFQSTVEKLSKQTI